ncbi:ADP-ribosylglycohydrolase family protein [Microbispora sp. NEAU-D428]|uniref:ADP-ribosylglycohydrolase family protein n=1 Tax=Microbispora sitophila TaxID=2771537 RepID=UPI0018668346|nr:ADP-ribosylglycohydrolase family protein [Microbispora sitophila]MBE3009461.1 ADP-ribosylglycohydrolase family protein [Microbispora sitophila]
MPYDDRPLLTEPSGAARRIHGAMIAFAAGDALGVPWEGRPPEHIDTAEVVRLPAPDRGWPRGSTSDDTAQMVLVARCLADTGGRPGSMDFLARLADAAPGVRGLGPTTRRALAHFHATGELPVPSAGDLATNGAAMRIAPVGWAVPPHRPERRRGLCEALSAATHRAPAAVASACVIAAMASSAVEGAGAADLPAVAAAEARWAGERYGPMEAVADAARGRWSPPREGVSLDAVETAAAVVHVIREAPDLAAALPYAVSLGGDADTVAALVGGVLGARDPETVTSLGWLGLVDLGEYRGLGDLATRLAALRETPDAGL